MKSIAALSFLVVVALVANSCSAGLLKQFGKGTETLGSVINQGAIKAEDGLSSLFGGKKKPEEKQPEPVVPVVPEPKPAAPKTTAKPELAKKDAPLPDIITKAKGDAPQIEIVYGKPAGSTTTSTQKPKNNAFVITDDTEVESLPPDGRSCPKGDAACRESIVGAAKCGPDEVFVDQTCRPRE